jgi:recombination protein RecA
VTEDDRRRAILHKLAGLKDRPAAFIPTGWPALDQLLGGGWPRAAVVELFGSPAAGKTTLLLRSVAQAQSHGFLGAWIDADHSFDPSYAASLGVQVAALPVAQPASAEEAMEIALRLVLSRALDLMIIDSAAALVPRLELEAQIGGNSPGLHARVLESGLRKLRAAAGRTAVSILFTNHARGLSHATALEDESSAGGPPLKIHAAVRIALEPARGGIRLRVRKNRLFRLGDECVVAPERAGELTEGP